MASAKVATVPCASMGAAMRPTPASVSVRQASFFGPRLTIQRAQTGSMLRAREAVKVEARSAAKGGQQVQVRMMSRQIYCLELRWSCRTGDSEAFHAN